MRSMVCGLMLGAALLAGCSDGNNSNGAPETSAPATTATESPTTPTPKETPVYSLGDKVSMNLLDAEVLDYKKGFEEPSEPDERYDAVLVKMCNTGVQPDEGGEFIFSPISWDLRDDNDGSYETFGTSGPGVPRPEFGYDRNPKIGDCVKGWIFYAVSKDTSIKTMVFRNDGADIATWRVTK